MGKIIRALASTLFVTVALNGAAQAENYMCKPEVEVVGSGAILGEKGGKRKAIRAWREAVRAKYGVFNSDDELANEGNGVVADSCVRSSIGLTICEARGRPCVEKSDETTYADNLLECTVADRASCDPKTKWVQFKLDELGYKAGPIDGEIGSKTTKAIKSFMKDKGIAVGPNAIDAVVEALKQA